jgi:hypothetical protein
VTMRLQVPSVIRIWKPLPCSRECKAVVDEACFKAPLKYYAIKAHSLFGDAHQILSAALPETDTACAAHAVARASAAIRLYLAGVSARNPPASMY